MFVEQSGTDVTISQQLFVISQFIYKSIGLAVWLFARTIHITFHTECLEFLVQRSKRILSELPK